MVVLNQQRFSPEGYSGRPRGTADGAPTNRIARDAWLPSGTRADRAERRVGYRRKRCGRIASRVPPPGLA